MVKVNWTTQSIEDIRSIAEFIAKDSSKYANLQVDLFFANAQLLENFPTAGRIIPEINSKISES